MESLSINSFPKSVRNGVVVCDIVEIEGKEKQSDVIEQLKKEGFRKYKKYHLWECTGIKFSVPSLKRYSMLEDKDLHHLLNVYSIFDRYSDMLPMRRMFEWYIEERYTFSCFKNGKYMGSQIYKLEGNTAIGEFVYALNQDIGTGGALLVELLKRCFETHRVKKLYVWIADDNIKSVATHKSIGFIRTEQYKVTMLRGKHENEETGEMSKIGGG